MFKASGPTHRMVQYTFTCAYVVRNPIPTSTTMNLRKCGVVDALYVRYSSSKSQKYENELKELQNDALGG